MQKTHMFYDPIPLDEDFPICPPSFSTPPEFPHVHNCFEIGFCWKGSGGVFQIDKKIYSCDPGCAVFINNKEYHLLTNATPENSEWDFINLDPAALLMGWIPPEEQMFDLENLSGSEFRNIYSENDAPELIELTKLLIREMKKGDRKSPSCVRALVWAIFTKLNEFAPGSGAELHRGSEEICLLYPALSHISRYYAKQLDIPTLASLCNMGITAFRKHFKYSIGMLPLEYINVYRLKAAATLLKNTSRQIIEIAGQTGFPTLSHFNRVFKSYYSCSPWNYRKRYRTGKTSSGNAAEF